MLTTPEEVAAALSGTPLAGLPTGYGPRGTILVRDVVPGDMLDSWRAAHARMPVTGRWPVLVTDDWDRGWLELRSLPDPSAPTAPELAEFDEETLSIDPWPSFKRYDEPVAEAEWVEFYAQGFYTDVAWSDEELRQVELPTTSSTVERWAYERVLADPVLTDRVRQGARWSVQLGNWYTPDRVSLLLLPTASPWLAAYWVNFYGAMGWAPGLGAVLRQWHEQCGARLVASWGTMLQLLVDKPPQSTERAWEVAGQIQGVASHYEGHRWELAVALPESEAWFLHNRP